MRRGPVIFSPNKYFSECQYHCRRPKNDQNVLIFDLKIYERAHGFYVENISYKGIISSKDKKIDLQFWPPIKH